MWLHMALYGQHNEANKLQGLVSVMGWRFKSSLGQSTTSWSRDLGHRESGAFFWGEDGRVEFRGAELRVEGRAFDQTHGIDANWNVAGFPDWRRLHIDGCRRDSHTTVSGIPGAVHFTG